MADGPVTLFWRKGVLAETSDWLVGQGYSVVPLDTHSWRAEPDVHGAIAAALEFPDYYGGNLAALEDCLSDVAEAEYGLRPEDTGLVLVFVGFDAFARRMPVLAQAIVDIFAKQSRTALLIGNRMLCLVQSDDPRVVLAPVGASSVSWNPSEWLDARRVL